MYTPKEYPKIIYKYRNWTNEFHKNLLTKNQLYLSSPEYFNDPFDCRIPENYKSLNTPKKIDKYIEGFISRASSHLLSMGINLQDERKRMRNDLTNNIDSIQNTAEQILFKSQDKHLGVLSMSARWNSILMWSHYADFHKGYCVGFYEEKIRNSELFGKGGPVNYNPNNDYPIISLGERSIEKGFKQTHTKSFDWQYEKEYRLVKLFFPDLPSDKDRTQIIDDDYFAEVLIGLLTPDSHKQEIIKIAKSKNIKVYQIERVPFKFEIIKKEIV